MGEEKQEKEKQEEQGKNIFISCSGDRARAAATALWEWLPVVLDGAKPWVSERDVDKGTLWLVELTQALVAVKWGVVCLTRESVSAPWVLFETGALCKKFDAKMRVWTYLLGGCSPARFRNHWVVPAHRCQRRGHLSTC